MPTIIDGYNFIGRSSLFELGKEGVEKELLERVVEYQKKKGGKFIIIFDGRYCSRTQKLSNQAVTLRFSPPGVEADDEIIRLIEKEPNKKSLTVVTWDQRLVKFARHQKVKVLSGKEFEKKLKEAFSSPEKSPKPYPPVSQNEVKYWLKFFKKSSKLR